MSHMLQPTKCWNPMSLHFGLPVVPPNLKASVLQIKRDDGAPQAGHLKPWWCDTRSPMAYVKNTPTRYIHFFEKCCLCKDTCHIHLHKDSKDTCHLPWLLAWVVFCPASVEKLRKWKLPSPDREPNNGVKYELSKLLSWDWSWCLLQTIVLV